METTKEVEAKKVVETEEVARNRWRKGYERGWRGRRRW